MIEEWLQFYFHEELFLNFILDDTFFFYLFKGKNRVGEYMLHQKHLSESTLPNMFNFSELSHPAFIFHSKFFLQS